MEKLFQHITQYAPLSPHEKAIITAKVSLRKFLKGQFVVQAGDVCSHQSYVLSGCLKSFSIDDEGQEHIVSFAIEDWWTGDLGSFITQNPADYHVQCIEPSELIQIPYDNMEMLFSEVPALERFFRVTIQNAYVATQRRVVDNMSFNAREKYLHFEEKYPELIQRVPQYTIASYLGITPQFLSKIKRQLGQGK